MVNTAIAWKVSRLPGEIEAGSYLDFVLYYRFLAGFGVFGISLTPKGQGQIRYTWVALPWRAASLDGLDVPVGRSVQPTVILQFLVVFCWTLIF